MGTAYWVFSDANLSVSFGGAFRVSLYGLTLKIGGTSGRALTVASTAGASFILEDCLLWAANTSATGSNVIFGGGDRPTYVRLRNCEIKTVDADQKITIVAKVEIVGGSFTGTLPDTFFSLNGSDPGGMTLDCWGVDFSAATTATMIADSSLCASVARFWGCKLPATTTWLAAQTNNNRSSAEVYFYDCATGDTHGLFGYYNEMGSIVLDSGIYFTAGVAARSWKITTTAYCDYYQPFQTPWLDFYNADIATSITPYFEIVRDGSTTPYTNSEVWAAIMAKTTGGSPLAVAYDDAQTLSARVAGTVASNQAAGAGLGSWTGESGTAWSGKIDSGVAFTPAEVGHIRGRITVGKASVTDLYVDPQVRV
jgi:hypothetical protein